MRYLMGVAAALGAGTAFNVGILVQKSAVDRLPLGLPLLRSLVKRPVWLLGFLLQFVFGTPLYLLAVGLIGPAVVPGIMAIGLVVLATGAVRVKKERLRKKEAMGIAFVVLAVAAFGLSRLSIDVLAFSMTDPVLLQRSVAFVSVIAVAAVGCAFVARNIAAGRGPQMRVESAAAFHAVRAGLWYNVSNLSLGFITAGLFGMGLADIPHAAVFTTALVVALVSNVFGVSATQNALAHGRAAVAIPLQDGIAQIVPVGVFFFVYRPYLPGPSSFAFLTAASVLLVTGVVLLTDRLAEDKKGGPAAGEPVR